MLKFLDTLMKFIIIIIIIITIIIIIIIIIIKEISHFTYYHCMALLLEFIKIIRHFNLIPTHTLKFFMHLPMH